MRRRGGVQYFCFQRDRLFAGPLRERLREAHWAYMDGFADQLVARGPVLDAAGMEPVGGVHLIEVADAAAAQRFVFEEPHHQAGVHRDVVLRRWSNELGRTMWQFPAPDPGQPRHLVLGLGGEPHPGLPPIGPASLIAFGPLLSDDGRVRLGSAALVQAPTAGAARAGVPGGHAVVEVHRWEFGGRPY